MPFTQYRATIDAPAALVWAMMKEKIRRPDKYIPGVVSVEFPQEFGPHTVERIMVLDDGKARKTVHEIITADDTTKTVIFKLKDDPVYTGFVINMVFDGEAATDLDCTMNWVPKDKSLLMREPNWATMLKNAVLQTKKMAEGKLPPATPPPRRRASL